MSSKDAADLLHGEAFPDADHDYGRGHRRPLSAEQVAQYRARRKTVVLNTHDVEAIAKPRGWVEGRDYIVDDSVADYVQRPAGKGHGDEHPAFSMDVSYMSARHKRPAAQHDE